MKSIGQESLSKAEAWQKKIAQYCNAQQITPELVHALIQEIRVSSDESIAITFCFDDEYRQILKDIERLKKEVA